MCVLSHSVESHSLQPMTVACQAPLSMEFSRQEDQSRLPFPAPGNLSYPGIETTSSVSPALASRLGPCYSMLPWNQMSSTLSFKYIALCQCFPKMCVKEHLILWNFPVKSDQKNSSKQYDYSFLKMTKLHCHIKSYQVFQGKETCLTLHNTLPYKLIFFFFFFFFFF